MKLSDLKCVDENINLDEYINFREFVKKSMVHPEWLGNFTKEDLNNLLNTGSKIWIYYLKNDPVCSMMLIPSDERALNKFEIDLSTEEVVDYGPMFVSPHYWGQHLQYQMLKYLDEYAKNIGYKYAAGTIHPDNTYSINNLVKDEFVYLRTKEFTRGTRNIYLKKY